MGVAQNERARVTQLLVFGSISQGAILGTFFVSHSPRTGQSCDTCGTCRLPGRRRSAGLQSVATLIGLAPELPEKKGFLLVFRMTPRKTIQLVVSFRESPGSFPKPWVIHSLLSTSK